MTFIELTSSSRNKVFTNLWLRSLDDGSSHPLVQQQIARTPLENQHSFGNRALGKKRADRIRGCLPDVLALARRQLRMGHLLVGPLDVARTPAGRTVPLRLFLRRLRLGLRGSSGR